MIIDFIRTDAEKNAKVYLIFNIISDFCSYWRKIPIVVYCLSNCSSICLSNDEEAEKLIIDWLRLRNQDYVKFTYNTSVLCRRILSFLIRINTRRLPLSRKSLNLRWKLIKNEHSLILFLFNWARIVVFYILLFLLISYVLNL